MYRNAILSTILSPNPVIFIRKHKIIMFKDAEENEEGEFGTQRDSVSPLTSPRGGGAGGSNPVDDQFQYYAEDVLKGSRNVDEIREQIVVDVRAAAELNAQLFPSLCRFCNSLYIYTLTISNFTYVS
jgi:hypothetical protein